MTYITRKKNCVTVPGLESRTLNIHAYELTQYLRSCYILKSHRMSFFYKKSLPDSM